MGELTLVELKEFPGFYRVPFLPELAINRSGRVIETLTNTEITPKRGVYPGIFYNGDWFHLHRLVAETFIPIPEFNVELCEVNHKDGDKYNSHVDNLEWVTYSGNIIHAYQTGLRSDNCPLLVKNLLTGEITRYYGIHECARAFNVSGANILWHLRPENRCKVSFKKYSIIRESEDWPDIDQSLIGGYRNGTSRMVEVTTVSTQQVSYYESMGTAAHFLGFNTAAIYMHWRRCKQKVYRGYIFTYVDEVPDGYKLIRLPRKERSESHVKPVPLLVMNTQTLEKTEWSSAADFAKHLGVSKETLQKSIWKKGFYGIYQIQYKEVHPNLKSRQTSPTVQ